MKIFLLIFDIQNWLWKYDFGTFWQTVITGRIFLKIFPWWHVDSWPKNLLLRTHHLWNSTIVLILISDTNANLYLIVNRTPKHSGHLPLDLLQLWVQALDSFLNYIQRPGDLREYCLVGIPYCGLDWMRKLGMKHKTESNVCDHSKHDS